MGSPLAPSCPADAGMCPHFAAGGEDIVASVTNARNDESAASPLDSTKLCEQLKQPKQFTSTAEYLSDEREKSSIPSVRGEWYYPSPSQFYKSVSRKGHIVDPSDIPVAVAIHNQVNEQSWQRIMEYEKLHKKECAEPKLIRFSGRAGELSYKARFYSFFGFEKPFDRHDWLVDRCGKKVLYLIDFYNGAPNEEYPVSIFIDARPKLNFSGLMDRVRVLFKRKIHFD